MTRHQEEARTIRRQWVYACADSPRAINVGWESLELLIATALEAAEERGSKRMYNLIQIWGTDACPECESGRVTLFVTAPRCIECHQKGVEDFHE